MTSSLIIAFRILAFLVMGSIFMPVVFLKLPSPFRASYFYYLLWIISVVTFHPDLLIKKSMIQIYLFLGLYFVGSNFLWRDVNFGVGATVFSSAYGMIQYVLVGVLMYSYFLKVKDFKGMAWVVVAILICIIITTIVSIDYQRVNKEIVRKLMAGSIEISVFDMVFGTYSFYNAVAFSMPAFAFYIKSNYVGIPLKALILLLVVFLIFPMIQASLTSTFLFAIIFFAVAMIARGKISTTVITISAVILLTLFTFKKETASVVLKASNFFERGSDIQLRVEDLAQTILISDYNAESGSTYFAVERLSRVVESWDGFLENPLFGGGNYSGHAFWLDQLAMFGLLGILPWYLIFSDQIKLNKKVLSTAYFKYYLLSIVMMISFGCLKNAAVSAHTMICIFFLIPGAGYLIYLREGNSPKDMQPLVKR
jgi:hypothetical protein